MKYKLVIQALKESSDPNVVAFVNEVEKHRRLTAEQRQYYQQNRQEPGAVGILVNDYIPYIIKAAYGRWLTSRGVSVLDLINEGVIGAYDAFRKHNYHGRAMVTVLRSTINRYIGKAANPQACQEPEDDCPLEPCSPDEVEWQNEDDIINDLDSCRERILLMNLIEEKMGFSKARIITDYFFDPEADIRKIAKKHGICPERVRQIVYKLSTLYDKVGSLWELLYRDFNLPVHEKRVKRNSHLLNRKFMRNRSGIEIRECCASCASRLISSSKGRWCTKHAKCVKSRSNCRDWSLNGNLQNAGDSGGKVKRKEYLDFLVSQRNREIEEGLKPRRLEETRALFEKLYGSIYY